MKYDEREVPIGQELKCACDRVVMKVETLAGELGLTPRTVYHWILGDNPLSARNLMRSVKILDRASTTEKSGTRLLNTLLRMYGTGLVAVPRVPAVDDSTAPLGERLERATLQLTQYLGRTSGEVAEASSPESAGGMEITAEEGRQITELLDELIGLATEMRGRVQEETSPFH